MAIQIGQKPSPTFQQPLDLLSDCHRRIESFLRALILVAEQSNGGALDARQKEGLETALRYFREAAPKHTADEEESLFPRMRAAGQSEAQAALEKIAALESDHRVADENHALVEKLGRQWLADNQLPSDAMTRMHAALRKLAGIYERHIAMEDNEIFPLARKTLSQEALRSVGQEMAARRGQSLSPGKKSL